MKRLHQLLKSERPLKWLFSGDSITHGSVHTFGARDYSELFSERLRTELRRPRDLVIKTAISGHTTNELLADFEWRHEQFRPDVAFVMIGMNDCNAAQRISREKFKANLVELCRRLAAVPSLAVLQTTCPILPGTAPEREPSFPAFMETIRETAAELRLPLVDHTRHWEALNQKTPGVHAYWMNNAFHPNAYGHRMFAELLYRELGIWNPAESSCRFFRPGPSNGS
ncbi:MAG: SGNH/GDSL hydrolase family protein [Verrucomicrobiae bacterium]|nr:SGNH/GDSL hydrolase family protein [Verrucomicrobiae bacterium]